MRETTLWLWYFGWNVRFELVRTWIEAALVGYEKNRHLRQDRLISEWKAGNREAEPDEFDVAEDEAWESVKRIPWRDRTRAIHAAKELQAEDESKPPGVTETVASLRTQLMQAVAGDPGEVHLPAAASLMGFDRLDAMEGRDPEVSQRELENTLPLISTEALRDTLAAASDERLDFLRWYLRTWYEHVKESRSDPDPKVRAHAEELDVIYDPRDPEYSEPRLLMALVVSLALLPPEAPG